MTVHQRAALAACVLAAVVWPAWAEAQSPIRGLRAERFDVSLRLLADGSVDVRETIVFRFTKEAFSHVDRELSLQRTDGIIDVRAFMDGRPLPEGREDGQARIRRGRRSVRVTWQFPDIVDQARAFTLEYRAMNVLSVANGRAEIVWTALPSRHRYVIDEARIEWRVPPDAVRVDPTTLDDPRWTSGALSDGWMASRSGVGVNESVELRDAFQASTLAVAIPQWQTHADRAVQMAPSFLIGAAILVVMGAGVFAMVRLRYPPPQVDAAIVRPAEPGDLPPALATSLTRGRVSITIAQLQAALLDLVRRGHIQIDDRGGGTRNRYAIRMAAPRTARPHEQVLTDALWLHMKQGALTLSAARGPLVRALPRFRAAVVAELAEAGLLDADRRAAARGLMISGGVVIALGVAGLVIFAGVFGHLGDLPLVVPAAVLLSGVLFLIGGQAMAVVSPAGAAASAAWTARKRLIRRDPAAHGEVWWPVAAGFGLTRTLAKVHPGGPHWLSHLSDPAAAMTAILVSTTVTSGSTGSGGGSAGAGGSSSAG